MRSIAVLAVVSMMHRVLATRGRDLVSSSNAVSFSERCQSLTYSLY